MRNLGFAIAMLFVGCGSDDGPEGKASTIASLVYSPNMATAGMPVVLQGMFVYSDPDADVAKFAAEVTLPDGGKQPVGPSDIAAGSGVSGTSSFMLTFTPLIAGHYTFDVWLLDDAGHESNRLTGTLDVQ